MWFDKTSAKVRSVATPEICAFHSLSSPPDWYDAILETLSQQALFQQSISRPDWGGLLISLSSSSVSMRIDFANAATINSKAPSDTPPIGANFNVDLFESSLGTVNRLAEQLPERSVVRLCTVRNCVVISHEIFKWIQSDDLFQCSQSLQWELRGWQIDHRARLSRSQLVRKASRKRQIVLPTVVKLITTGALRVRRYFFAEEESAEMGSKWLQLGWGSSGLQSILDGVGNPSLLSR